MFVLQLIIVVVVVVVVSLMGPEVQEVSFYSSSCFHLAKEHRPSCAATEEVLRVLLPQELSGGGQGPSALLWNPFHISSSPNNMAWFGAMPGTPGVRLRASCRLHGIPAWEAMSLSSRQFVP